MKERLFLKKCISQKDMCLLQCLTLKFLMGQYLVGLPSRMHKNTHLSLDSGLWRQNGSRSLAWLWLTLKKERKIENQRKGEAVWPYSGGPGRKLKSSLIYLLISGRIHDDEVIEYIVLVEICLYRSLQTSWSLLSLVHMVKTWEHIMIQFSPNTCHYIL